MSSVVIDFNVVNTCAVDKATCCFTSSFCWNVEAAFVNVCGMNACCRWPCTLEEPLILHQTREGGKKEAREAERRQGRKTKWKPISRVATAMQSSLTTSPPLPALSLPRSLHPLL